jgi:hypothetical protein
MPEAVEEIVAPAAIERAIKIYQQFQARDPCSLRQARKALTQHIFGLVDAGERNEDRMTVSGLAHLKSLERYKAKKSGTGRNRTLRK